MESRLIEKLKQLKQEKNAIIAAHYYQRDEVKFVADFVGDSLELSKKCKETDADVILFAGVRFMAETAKILNPMKTVLISSLEAGCSLADSITADQVRKLKARYPEAAVVSYVNTSAKIKAESDVCCTSANYLKIIEALPNKQVIFIPDVYMARNIAGKTTKEIIGWNGECIVHKDFTTKQVELFKREIPGLQVLVHIECPPKVVSQANYAGSTSGIRKYVKESNSKEFMILTECNMLSTLEQEFPEKKFYTPCTICPHMKKITLENLVWSLETGRHEIRIQEDVRIKASKSLEYMLELS